MAARRSLALAFAVTAAGFSLALLLLASPGGERKASQTLTAAARPVSRQGRCAVVKRSLPALRAAVGRAGAGKIVCLANGSYGKLDLPAARGRAHRVIVRAAHPGKARIDGARLARSRVTVAGFDIAGEVEVEPGSSGVSVADNLIHGGYFGVDAGPTTTTTVNDVAIVGNRFVGPYGEDAIRLNRYHDANGDHVGALVAGNEFKRIRENGNHSDCLQTVWVGDHLVYRGNYLHDNHCQGFFVKDQASTVVGIVVEDNLFLRNDAPCAPSAPGCGPSADLQVFGPYRGLKMRHNTIWGRGAIAAFQNGTGPRSRIADNAVYKFWTSTDLTSVAYEDNLRCLREEAPGGAWPRPEGELVRCHPRFRNPKADDYRLASGRGVTWAPRQRHFGP